MMSKVTLWHLSPKPKVCAILWISWQNFTEGLTKTTKCCAERIKQMLSGPTMPKELLRPQPCHATGHQLYNTYYVSILYPCLLDYRLNKRVHVAKAVTICNLGVAVISSFFTKLSGFLLSKAKSKLNTRSQMLQQPHCFYMLYKAFFERCSECFHIWSCDLASMSA